MRSNDRRVMREKRETDCVRRGTRSVDRPDRQVAGTRQTHQLDISCTDVHGDRSHCVERSLSTNSIGVAQSTLEANHFARKYTYEKLTK